LDGWRVRGVTETPETRGFHDGDQKGESAEKKMLRMKVDPTMLLKTNGRETTNPVLANMFLKTSYLMILPV
jgi:hypothetical protein